MLSQATPLLLTASPKITLHWSDGFLCIHFPYSLYFPSLTSILTLEYVLSRKATVELGDYT